MGYIRYFLKNCNEYARELDFVHRFLFFLWFSLALGPYEAHSFVTSSRTLGPSALRFSLRFCLALPSAADCAIGCAIGSCAAAPAPTPPTPLPTSDLTRCVSNASLANPVCPQAVISSMCPSSPFPSPSFASTIVALRGRGALAITFESCREQEEGAPAKDSAVSIFLKRDSTRSAGKADTGRRCQSQSHFSGRVVVAGHLRGACDLSVPS